MLVKKSLKDIFFKKSMKVMAVSALALTGTLAGLPPQAQADEIDLTSMAKDQRIVVLASGSLPEIFHINANDTKDNDEKNSVKAKKTYPAGKIVLGNIKDPSKRKTYKGKKRSIYGMSPNITPPADLVKGLPLLSMSVHEKPLAYITVGPMRAFPPLLNRITGYRANTGVFISFRLRF